MIGVWVTESLSLALSYMAKKILVVDDDAHIREVVRFALEKAGLEAVEAGDGQKALESFAASIPDLIILDIAMPEMDGLAVCREVRRRSDVPILFLSSRTDEVDRVVGLEIGGDDYVTKPFSPRELVLRVKRLLRSDETPESKDHIKLKDLTVDIPRHQVMVKNKPVDLTATEFKLLTLLLQRKGRVQTREKLLQDVWEYDNLIDTRTVDTHMRRLREKLGAAARYLDTVRGVGYRFLEE